MSSKTQRKAVYFTEEELQLREWAENRSEGFSLYIKRLIAEDQQGERLRKNVIEIISDYTQSQAGQIVLIQLARELAVTLDGKLISKAVEEDVAVAAELFTDEIDQIASFMISTNR